MFIKVKMAMNNMFWVRIENIMGAYWDGSTATLDIRKPDGEIEYVETELTLPELEAIMKTNPVAEVLYGKKEE